MKVELICEVLLLVGVFFTVNVYAEVKEKDHVPLCATEYKYAYYIHQEAMRNAKKGNCKLAIRQFTESVRQWKRLSTYDKCDKEQRTRAESNVG